MAWKIDPASNEVVDGWPVLTGAYPYNYSDMTGVTRLTVTEPTGHWTEIIDAGRPGDDGERAATKPDPADLDHGVGSFWSAMCFSFGHGLYSWPDTRSGKQETRSLAPGCGIRAVTFV